jgi:hypothetical protein
MNIPIAPVNMLVGQGSGAALAVLGLLIALAVMAQSKSDPSIASRS